MSKALQERGIPPSAGAVERHGQDSPPARNPWLGPVATYSEKSARDSAAVRDAPATIELVLLSCPHGARTFARESGIARRFQKMVFSSELMRYI